MRVSSLLKILLMCAAIPLRAIDDEAGAAPSSTELAAGNAAGGASSAELNAGVTSVDGAAAGDGAGDLGNADASTSLAGGATSAGTAGDLPNGTAQAAGDQFENAAASSALNASTGAGTAESQEAGTTAGEPHPALAHLATLEAMVDRMLLRGEQFAMDEWKSLTHAIRTVL